MLFEPYFRFFELIAQAWKQDKKYDRVILILLAISFAIILITIFSREIGWVDDELAKKIGTSITGLALSLSLFVAGRQITQNRVAQEQKLEKAEEDLRNHPEKPQLAWDLARVKLESYLDRNLKQINSIFWLTLFVMSCGFALTSYGIYQAFQNNAKLEVSIVSAASGVIVTFIGGSFLIIYKSILAQSKEYVTVLERINAVGMAVHVISTIEENNTELKSQTQAELAKSLLTMYAASSKAVISDN